MKCLSLLVDFFLQVEGPFVPSTNKFNPANLLGIATRGIIALPGFQNQIFRAVTALRQACKCRVPFSSRFISCCSGLYEHLVKVCPVQYADEQHGTPDYRTFVSTWIYCCWQSNYVFSASLFVSSRLSHIEFL